IFFAVQTVGDRTPGSGATPARIEEAVRSGIWYTTAAVMVTLVVIACCAMLLEGTGRAGAWSGAVIAFAVQVTGFWLLFVWMLPDRQGLAHAAGMLLRMLLLMVLAL